MLASNLSEAESAATEHTAVASHNAHDTEFPNGVDTTFPLYTTDTNRAGFTDEYTVETAEGFKRKKSIVDEKVQEDLLVTWKINDPENPQNWSKGYRFIHTAVVASLVVCVAFGSSCVTGDLSGPANTFNVSMEVSILQTSLMVCGFGVGPLLWSPLSELYGRRPIYIIAFGVYTIFNIPCALAENIGTILVFRFLCGCFASAPLTLAGGSISDIFAASERGNAIAWFAAAPYGGPVIGALVSGFIGMGAGWRWIYWVNLIFAGVMWIIVSLLPETYSPVLLARRAAKLRKETGNQAYVTEQERFRASFMQTVKLTMVRPFTMLMSEPILVLMSLYIALIYGLLYAFFFAYPVVFGELYGFNDGQIGLTFIGILIGTGLALVVTPQLEKRYNSLGREPTPEDRLPGMMFAAPFVPISLFIFAWTSYPWVHWIGPTISGIPFGFGMVLIYYTANNYLIDTFITYCASALAAKTVVRSGLGAAFPLFITQMYHRLGFQWASTLLAFISLAMVPIPFAFYRYGAAIRARSKTASQ
jgi:multidrug resistance protein